MEANFYQFGLMGAQRAAYAGGGHRHGMGMGLGLGGAAGPLVRSSSGRLRMSTSQGFRWLQDQRQHGNVCLQLIAGTAAGATKLEDIYDSVTSRPKTTCMDTNSAETVDLLLGKSLRAESWRKTSGSTETELK